jgi:hypothetical protein
MIAAIFQTPVNITVVTMDIDHSAFPRLKAGKWVSSIPR